MRNELNIRENKRITPNNPEEYKAYKTAVDFFQESVNASADPCTDFFQYACGKYDKPVSFSVARAKILEDMVDQLIHTLQKSEALRKAKLFTDACVEATKDSSENQRILETNNYLLPRVNKLTEFLGTNFTYIFGGEVTSRPNSMQLANALGYMSFDQGIDTLVTPGIDTNWPEPTKGYFLFLDQNTAYMGKAYYDVKAFKTIKENYVNSSTEIVATFARAQKISIDKAKLKENIRGLIEFEQMIALNYSSDDETRRVFKRSWNPQSIAGLKNYSFVDWTTYLKHPEQYKKMNNDYGTWDQTKLVNYLFMRLILSNAQYLPSYADSFKEMPEEPIVLGRKRRPYFRFERSNNLKEIRTNCVGLANRLMQYATGRVYIDYEYPNDDKKKLIREKVGGMMQNVIHSFQGMLDSLDWMTEETKKEAHQKTLGIGA
ncbi:peptidase family M13 [Oesophagostomum dentatum]|uniref:Peptidase family M13 n=1 Tax=Oesophagostomum dentatum TaxID=61180 RepID=A0A0B1TB35_OESDE|nr:peptidase family M13 [Oesophagostomum dentatum]